MTIVRFSVSSTGEIFELSDYQTGIRGCDLMSSLDVINAFTTYAYKKNWDFLQNFDKVEIINR